MIKNSHYSYDHITHYCRESLRGLLYRATTYNHVQSQIAQMHPKPDANKLMSLAARKQPIFDIKPEEIKDHKAVTAIILSHFNGELAGSVFLTEAGIKKPGETVEFFVKRIDEVFGSTGKPITVFVDYKSRCILSFCEGTKEEDVTVLICYLKPLELSKAEKFKDYIEIEFKEVTRDATEVFVQVFEKLHLFIEKAERHSNENVFGIASTKIVTDQDRMLAGYNRMMIELAEKIRPGETVDLVKATNQLKFTDERNSKIGQMILSFLQSEISPLPGTSYFNRLDNGLWKRTSISS